MSSFLPPAVVFLLGNIEDLKLKLDEADVRLAKTDAAMAESGGKGKAAFLGVAAAIAGVAAESVHLASEFDASMARINTQDNAQLTTQQMKDLKNSVLDLGGPVAQTPEALSEAMIHVYGSGLKGAAALDLLTTAAKGATIGNANLTDVTNALDAAIAIGIKGTGDYQVAMGELNATVGAGDMTMQNLAEALGGPMLATVKGYGLSITDVGAALAVFGDRNIRGAEAATELRMATQALAVPAATGGKALASIGLATDDLRKDLQQGGLKQALNDLNDRLLAAGYTSTTAGSLITAAFGKKAGGGLNVLLDSLASSTSNFNEKFEAVGESGKNFASAWSQTQDTLAFKIKATEAALQGMGVKIGEFLIPAVSGFIDYVDHTGGPALAKFGDGLRDAFDSPAAHEAEAMLLATGRDVITFLKDAAGAAGDFEHAVAPAAAVVAGVFLVALRAVGTILSDVVGPALEAVGGFVRDNTGLVTVLSEVALAGLITRMLYVKALAGVDMFATFAAGIGRAAESAAYLARATASGVIFDTMRVKVAAAADAVRGLTVTTQAAAAATAAQAAATTAAGVAEQSAALQTMFGAVAAKAKAGNLALLAASTTTAATAAEIEGAATEAMSAKTALLAAAAGITTKKVQALGEASLATAAAQQEAAASAAAAAAAQEEAATAGGHWMSGLGKSLPVIGLAVTGIGLLGNEIGHLAGVGDHTALSVAKLTTAMTGIAAGTPAHVQQLADLGTSLAEMSQKMGRSVAGLTSYDQSLASLVSSGHASDAAAVIAKLSAETDSHGNKLINVTRDFPAYLAALDDAALRAKQASTATDDASASLGGVKPPLDAAAQAAQDASDALNNVTAAFADLTDHLQASGDLDAFKKDILEVSDTVKKNGASLQDNTLAGLANREAFRAAGQQILTYRDTQIKQLTATEGVTQATKDANNAAADQATQLLATWKQAGANKDQIDAYAKALGLVPKDLNTTVTVGQRSLDEALAKMQALRSAGVGGGHVVGHDTFKAAGGWVRGPGTTTSDSVPAMLSNREFVVSAAGAASVPPGLLDAINNGDLASARASLGGMGSPTSGPLTSGSSGGGDIHVTVYVQDPGQPKWRVAKNVRTEVLRYDRRNSGNGLALAGTA